MLEYCGIIDRLYVDNIMQLWNALEWNKVHELISLRFNMNIGAGKGEGMGGSCRYASVGHWAWGTNAIVGHLAYGT